MTRAAKLGGTVTVGEEIVETMSAPTAHGAPMLPKRGGPRGMLPSTWLGHSVHLEYADGFGSAVETSGTLLEVFPVGPVLAIAGVKTLVSWDRLIICALVDG